MFPKLLKPNDYEDFIVGNKIIQTPKCIIQFKKWNGVELKETFGNKPIIDVDGQPMFAELAIRDLFIKSGWKSIWVETYARLNKEPVYMSSWDFDKTYKNQTHSKIQKKQVLNMLTSIAKLNNKSYSGCWDVLGWKANQVIFAEAKRTKKDSIRYTQINWLKAGLKYGLKPENFMVVQWDFI